MVLCILMPGVVSVRQQAVFLAKNYEQRDVLTSSQKVQQGVLYEETMHGFQKYSLHQDKLSFNSPIHKFCEVLLS